MLKSIHFKNFKALRDTTLPLGPFTLLVGPNGSGKSSALQALKLIRGKNKENYKKLISVGLDAEASEVAVSSEWETPFGEIAHVLRITQKEYHNSVTDTNPKDSEKALYVKGVLDRTRLFAFQPELLARPVQLNENYVLEEDGSGLANVLGRLRDVAPERFSALNAELSRWLPEYGQIAFDVPGTGHWCFSLITLIGSHRIPAESLSYGTLVSLALLTLAHLPEPPAIICLEDPDRGIHPRLLRDVRDALYQLAYPDAENNDREPTQIIVTTHSPYLVDLFKDHPEEIVLANKRGLEVQFERLSDRPHVQEIIQDAALGEAWYSGILGGVPNSP